MAASAILRNARLVLKFMVDGSSYESVMKNVEVVAAAPGKCSCELKLDEFHLNLTGGLHGGFTATLVDQVSSMAIICAEKPPGVSVDMNITYMNKARLGDTILIEAECLKLGKTLAFATVDIRNKSDGGKIVAQGRHTKHIGHAYTGPMPENLVS